MKKETHNIESPLDKNPLHPFRTPEGYFDDFKVSIMERIRSEEQLGDLTPAVNTPPRKRFWYIIGAAAVIIFALIINYMPGVKVKQDLHANNIEILSEDEFNEFIIDDTAEDYWRQILLEGEGEDDLLSRSVNH